jgi:hypothetical protein
MKLRWKILIILGILFVLMAVSLTVTLHVQPSNELDAYKQSLRARGEKLELSEALPPPAAAEENSVVPVREAFKLLDSRPLQIPYAMKMVSPGRAVAGWSQPDVRGDDFTNSWDDFSAYIAAQTPAIDLLHQVRERPKLDFQLDYSKGTFTLPTHLPPLRISAQLLDAATLNDLHQGDTGAALTNLLSQLALVHNDVRDDYLICHLVRLVIATLAVAPTWEMLQATNVTETQLAALQQNWSQLEFLRNAETIFVIKRIVTDGAIQKSRESHEDFQRIFCGMGTGSSSPSVPTRLRQAVFENLWRAFESYSTQLQHLKRCQIILESLRAMQTNRSEYYKADFDGMVSRLSALRTTNSMTVNNLGFNDIENRLEVSGLINTVSNTLRTEDQRRLVVTAIALKRFQLKHGQWPETLAELSPDFLPAVPIDPYDGKPLKYHSNPDGTFLLYSVGEDGVDDGGDPSPVTSSSSSSPNLNWTQARDWVWPQPASPAEVQYFYEHPPK